MPKSGSHAMISHVLLSARTSSASDDRWTRQRVTLILVLSLIGYPLLGTLVTLTTYPSLVASIPVRLSVLALSLSLLVTFRLQTPSVILFRRVRLTPLRCALLLFWLSYVSRLLWDWLVKGMPDADMALLFFIVVSLIPALALLSITRSLWDANAFARLAFFAGATTCAFAVGTTLSGLAGERSLIEETGRLAFDTVNPITYGHVAVTTLLAGLVGWSENGRRRPLWMQALVTLGCIAALVCLQLSASKGPVVALAICLLALGVSQQRYRWVLIASVPVLVAFMLVSIDGAWWQRFSGMDEDLSTIERQTLLANAFQQFIDNPFLGHAFVESETHSYPHNPLLEAGMATGVLGFALYGGILLTCCARLIKWIAGDSPDLLLALVALQYVVAEHLSGSLYASSGLWVSLAMVVAVTTVSRSHSLKAESTGSLAFGNTPQ